MTNEFYNHDDGYPAFSAQGASSAMRSQFDKIGVAFDKFPALTGKASYVWAVNAGATAVEAVLSTGTGNVVRATDPTFTLTDTVTNNASITQHGWMPKLNNSATSFFNGVGGWTAIAGVTVRRSARTSNTILAAADQAYLIDITSGTFSQTFTAAATLADGWWCYIRNSGTGDITLDPNGAELIDGLATFIMYPNEVRLILCDGAALTSVVIHSFKRTYTANGTFVKPPGYLEFSGMVWGSGSSGQRTNNLAVASAGGAGGGCSDFKIASSAFGASETITVGAGGTAVSTVASGNLGNNSAIGTIFTVYANGTATSGGSVKSGLTGVTPSSGGNIAQPSGYEGGRSDTIASPTIWGGASPSTDGSSAVVPSSVFGAAAGGSISSGGAVRAPGTSTLGGNGGAANTNTSGVDGVAPGGGGGATQTGTVSGAGARGEVQIWGIA